MSKQFQVRCGHRGDGMANNKVIVILKPKSNPDADTLFYASAEEAIQLAEDIKYIASKLITGGYPDNPIDDVGY